VLLLAAAVGLVSPALADDKAEFSETIKHAVAEYEGGNWGEAHALFARAHDLNPSARTWRGLGLASFELRHYLDAIKELRAALEDWRKPLNPTQRQEVDSVLARAEQYVAGYHITLEPPQAKLEIDSQPIQLQDGWLRLDPGEYVLTAHAEGYHEYRATLRPEAGTRAELPVKLVARDIAPVAAPPSQREQVPQQAAAPAAPRNNERRRGMLWAGGIGLAVGVAFDIWAWRIYAARVSKSEDVINSLPEYDDKREQWLELRAPLLGFGITGAALTSLGTTLLVAGSPRERLPWWAAGLGAALGAGLAAWGVSDIVQGTCASPDARVCAKDGEQRERGTLLLFTSAPLFMLPITKLARGSGRSTEHADLQIMTNARGLALRGSW
jgi:hypothetical protein